MNQNDNQCNGSRLVVAVFDFDGTITDRHTFWRFLRLIVGPLRFWTTVIGMVAWIVKLYTHKTDVLSAREVLIYRVMKGLSLSKVENTAREFARNAIPNWVRKDALKRIQWHRNQGHQLILISNSAEYYLAPWAQSLGFDAVFGSKFEVKNNFLTGRLDGDHCQGEQKVECLKQYLGELSQYEIHAYGDSDGDLPLLQVADVAYYLTCDPELANYKKVPPMSDILGELHMFEEKKCLN